MDIQDLGAIGEFVSSLVVLATLLYLSVQVRQTKLSVQSSSWKSGVQSIADVNTNIISDPGLAAIFQRGMADPDNLDSVEQLRLSLLLANLLHIFHCWYLDDQKGLVDKDAWESEQLSMITMLSQPGGERFWRQFGVPYTAGFRTYVDAKLEEYRGSEASRYKWDNSLSE